jgi:Tol biopolymer transport system component
LIALTLAAVFWGIASKLQSPSAGRAAVTHVTTNGETEFISASPNGKFLAYVLDKGDYQSLWLYDVATASDVMLSPTDARDSITAVAFAADGENIYYVSSSRLYRIPILGGKSEPILEDVDSGSYVSVSPDGNNVAFLRSSNGNEMDLIVANVKDRRENILASSQRPRNFYSRLAWSPDGKSIACAKRGVAGEGLAIVVLSADDGSEIQRFKMREVVSDLIWKYDGTAILVAAYLNQIGRVLQYDLSGGNKATTLTDNLISYTGLSMSSDGSRLFAVREDVGVNLWVLAVSADLPARQITTGFDRFDGLSALVWITGDRLAFNSQPREKGETDSIRADGSDQNQISRYYSDGISPDGRYLIMGPSHEVVPVISVYDTMSGKSEPLTTGNLDVSHVVSPDGQWTAFTRSSDDVSIWKVSMSGGQAVRLTAGPEEALWPAISHDGRFVTFYRPHVDTNGKFTADIAYVDSNGGTDIGRFKVDAQFLASGKTAPQWSSDGRSIYFVRLRDGASNIWKLPIDGSEPTQITHLKSGRIYNFTLSPDESQIALSYGLFSRDAVQIDYR